MTNTTEARERGAQREKFFFLIRTDDEHNRGAGTRREARKKFFPLYCHQKPSRARARPRAKKKEKREKKKKDLRRSPNQLKFPLVFPLVFSHIRSRTHSHLLQSISRLALKGTPTKLQCTWFFTLSCFRTVTSLAGS